MSARLRLVCLAMVCAAIARAWQQPMAGHWEGAIKAEGQDVAITIDLAPDSNGGWTGALNMPAQGARDIPLGGITVKGDAVRFRMFDSPESPVFEGKLAGGGQAISGQVSGGGQSGAFELKRTGEASLPTPRPSTPVSKDLAGTWQGILTAADKDLRLELQLAQGANGAASGTLASVGLTTSPRIPITTITQKDNRLELEVRAVGGSYSGALEPSGDAISGTWTQAGVSTPLVFHRLGAIPQP